MRRSKLQRELDLKNISELRLKYKMSQDEIAKKLGITQQQVSKDLSTLTQRWLQECNINTDIYKAESIQTINHVQKECWLSWDKSKQDKTKKQLKNKEQKAGNEKIISSENSCGDIRFLELIVNSERDKLKIVGGHAPIKQKHSFEPIEFHYHVPIDSSMNNSIDD